MTYHDVYIGKLAEGPDPFDHQGTWKYGNAPEAESPLFPPHGAGSMSEWPWHQLVSGIEDGRYEGKQIDWGGWAARVTKKDILEFVAEVYPDDYGSNLPHLRKRLDELLAYVHALSDEGPYALVAVEF